ncbi:hypothetical protein CH293_07285 [Rhodococcus sp. 14-2470-1b]|uniref:hypothetical protein n=1 Tax=Rhodococcus sp. 14-2470-1b TaxID=2023149 RepID=UPI000B9A24BC|nr:hypothetical protein [Rhodococcus sp. 14-2470-1b]OZF54512.1 hypothetical protein CH293_07285 [Rhodococcus sp. 14-2470-1b]
MAARVLAHLTVFVGAFTAVWAVVVTPARNFAYVAGGDRLDVFVGSAAAAATVAAVVAVVVAVFVTGRRTLYATTGIGVVLLAAVSFGSFDVQMHLRALAGGLILGGCAVLAGCGNRRTMQCALVVGVLAGMVLVPHIESSPVRYAEYLSNDSSGHYILVALAVLAVLLAFSNVEGVVERVQHRTRVLTVGVLVPVGGLVLYWLFVRSVDRLGADGAMQDRWLLGIAVVPLLVGAAFALPRTTGTVVLAALAFVAAPTTGSMGFASAVVFVALLVVGVVVGWRRPLPLVGFLLIALVAAMGLFADSQLDAIESAVTVVILPVALGLLFSSLLPTSPPASVIAVTTPIAVTVPIVAEFGWTAYTPLTRVPPVFSPSGWEWTSTAISVGSVLAAAGAYLLLQARRGRPNGTTEDVGEVPGGS